MSDEREQRAAAPGEWCIGQWVTWQGQGTTRVERILRVIEPEPGNIVLRTTLNGSDKHDFVINARQVRRCAAPRGKWSEYMQSPEGRAEYEQVDYCFGSTDNSSGLPQINVPQMATPVQECGECALLKSQIRTLEIVIASQSRLIEARKGIEAWATSQPDLPAGGTVLEGIKGLVERLREENAQLRKERHS